MVRQIACLDVLGERRFILELPLAQLAHESAPIDKRGLRIGKGRLARTQPAAACTTTGTATATATRTPTAPDSATLSASTIVILVGLLRERLRACAGRDPRQRGRDLRVTSPRFRTFWNMFAATFAPALAPFGLSASPPTPFFAPFLNMPTTTFSRSSSSSVGAGGSATGS